MGAKLSSSAVEFNYNDRSAHAVPYEKSLIEFTALKVVNLSCCNIGSISSPISYDLHFLPPIVDTLSSLDLSTNSLTSLPEEFGLLVNLKKLFLQSNKLTRLPSSFPALYKLEKLYLSDNYLEELPLQLQNMQNLKIIHLHNNKLNWIPNDLGNIPSIEQLTVYGNPIDPHILLIDDLDHLLSFLRNQETTSEYSASVNEFKHNLKNVNGLGGFRGGLIYAFRIMLINSSARSKFLNFLEKEYSAENLRFYFEEENFRSMFPSNFPIVTSYLYNSALKIYRKYISETASSKYAINIPSSVRKNIIDSFAIEQHYFLPKKVNQWVFSKASGSILKLMLEDSLQRFRNTPEGKAIWTSYEVYENNEELAKAQKDLNENRPKRKIYKI